MAIEHLNGSGQGRVSYNKAILLSIINLSAKEISGVASLCENFGGSKLGKIFSSNYYEGVKITNTKDGLAIDVYVNVYAQYNVSEIACRVQENIKNSIISMTGMPVKSINVHVLGVEFVKPE
ncbi:MAG: Asp23/Gls24 family envelope stress response protein [Clostridia bacterium]|nr:Asp23/Gls24 family envelope stress response protein [Clostridia bacterium]